MMQHTLDQASFLGNVKELAKSGNYAEVSRIIAKSKPSTALYNLLIEAYGRHAKMQQKITQVKQEMLQKVYQISVCAEAATGVETRRFHIYSQHSCLCKQRRHTQCTSRV